jgi:ABC-type glycerol-3-phosphate transport system substrate-binding protein
MMKRMLIVVLILVCCTVLFACGNKQESAGGKTKISFWYGFGGPLGESLEGMIADFNADHPDIEVAGVSMGQYAALSQKIMAAIAANNPPTLAQVYENWTANFIDAGAIVPLEPFIRGPEGFSQEDLEDIFPVFLEGGEFQGQIWTFPFNKGLPAIYYNKEMFRKAGLDPDVPPRTWEEFREMATRLTIDENGDGRPEQWGTSFSIPTAFSMYQQILVQNGGQIMSADDSRFLFDSPEGVAALQFLVDLVEKDHVAYIAPGAYEHQTDFVSQKVAMIQGYIVSRQYMEPQLTFQPGLAPVPQGRRKAVLITGTNLAIFSKASEAQQQAAWTFVKWLADVEQQARWAIETSYVPIRRSALESETMKAEFERVPGLEAIMRQMDYAQAQPKSAEWFAGRRELEEEAIEPVMRGKMPAGEALRSEAEKLNQELDQSK